MFPLMQRAASTCTSRNIQRFIFNFDIFREQVSQLKSAIDIHNESIEFLKRKNAELKGELDDAKGKVSVSGV